MNGLKIRKAPIILPLLLLALSLTAYTLLSFRGVSAADSVSLGRQRLADLDYSGAVAAFTQAIELDPGSRDARLGLAQAYMESGSYSLAHQVLEDAVNREKPDIDAVKMMIEAYRRNGQLSQAVNLSQTLVNTTDEDEYYVLREELLKELYARPRSAASGTDQNLILKGGQILAQGSNIMGQLGLDPARTSQSEKYIDAGFTGTPAKVVCTGRTSLVIDMEGGLWAAGENRWGQLGTGCAETSPESGWRKLECPGPVADAAGTTGRLLLLLTDGSLWTAGADNSQVFTRLPFPTAVSISSCLSRTAVLTADGNLYCSESSAPGQWSMAAQSVRSFMLSENQLCWVGYDNTIHTEHGIRNAPGNWYEGSEICPTFTVEELALAGKVVLLTDTDGELYRLNQDNGAVDKIDCSSPVAALYYQGGTLYQEGALLLEHEDGTIQVWEGSGDQPKLLDEYIS